MAEALLAGAGLGAAFGELLKFVFVATRSCRTFKHTLNRLLKTLISLDPLIQVMEQQNSQLKRRKEELKTLINIMGQGKQLVLECSQINRLNVVARVYYEKKLQELITSLERFIANDMQVQVFRDIKDILLCVMRILRRIEKCPCLTAEEDATASSSHPISTLLLQDLNESEPKDQLELWLSWFEKSISSLSAESSTKGINANADNTHKKKEFMFRGFLSVTVISAENLPAMDLNGKSDPYVVLTLKKATSKVEITYETKVVNKCLDPVWNQTFVFDVEDGLNDELVVQVWDKDTIKKDDFIGKCTFSLHRVITYEKFEGSFKLSRAERAYLKLSLKWMLQPIDCDSNFLPLSSTSDMELKPRGTLKVKLLQAKELPNIFKKPNPFVQLSIQASGDKVKKSKTINTDFNPIWNEHFEFSVEGIFPEQLNIEVYDDKKKNPKPNKLIGCAAIQLSELQSGKVKYVWSKLELMENQSDNKIRGQVHMELLYCSFGMEKSLTNAFDPNCSMVFERSANRIEANGNENAVTQRGKEVINSGFFSVTVISAENLPALNFMGKSDPFVVLTLRKAKSKEEIKRRTRVVNGSTDSRDCTFVFDVEDGLNDVVIIEVPDNDTFRKKLGRCILSLTKVILEGEYIESFELVGPKSGSLKLQLKWNPK